MWCGAHRAPSEAEPVRDPAVPGGIELGLVEAVSVPLVDPARALHVDADVRAGDLVAEAHADLARALGEARLVRRDVGLDRHAAATREHVGRRAAREGIP